jgi:uncharacterized protein YjbJ (UPF0337 family)
MADLKKRINNATDKIAGETKAAAGRVTGDKNLELKGNLQSVKADIKTNVMDVKDEIKKSINRKDKL